ncbi:MAG: carboxymuconolactone decarboxylase family protein [Gammaproteobacteria bacterium]|jgi:AhpD family alkylhydroperoxidase|nr:carboxymuconolactone decarboxylase family protein [Gammaproteobacteria bacterium]
MATVALIEYEDASPEVRAVYDDIREVRQTDFINNFWKGLANNPAQLRRTWEQIKAVMAPGAIDAMTKEMIYVAVSVANACEYCIHSHTAAARAKGMTDEQYNELLAIIGLAHQTNGLVSALQLEVDDAFKA